MSRITPQLREFATRLIAHETTANPPETDNPATFFVCEKLRPHLATLMGNAGFCALLTRALALATVQVPSLKSVLVKSDGSLDGLQHLATECTPEEKTRASLALLTQLLGLLVAFIGENLTVRLIHQVWPTLSPPELDPGMRGKHEEKP